VAGRGGAGGGGTGTGGSAVGGATGTCPASALAPGDSNKNVMVGTLNRSYVLHIPTGYTGSKPLPLVIDFHPLPSTGSSCEGVEPLVHALPAVASCSSDSLRQHGRHLIGALQRRNDVIRRRLPAEHVLRRDGVSQRGRQFLVVAGDRRLYRIDVGAGRALGVSD